MCKAITCRGYKCTKEPNKPLCYIHNKIKNKKVELATVKPVQPVKPVHPVKPVQPVESVIIIKRNDINTKLVVNSKTKAFIRELYDDNCELAQQLDQLEADQIIAKECIQNLVDDNNSLRANCNLLMNESKQIKVQPKVQPKQINSNQIALENRIKNLKWEVNRLTERLNDSNKLNDKMKPDYDRYQIIRSYEGLQQQLDHIKFNNRGDLYHDLRLTRNIVAHPVE